MKLLDTNVIMYALGRDHPYREACFAIVQEARRDPEAFGIDAELGQELLDVYVRREGLARASEAVTRTFAIFPYPFAITRREIEQAVLLLKPRSSLSPRDAIHAAVCLTNGLEGIVSADTAFDRLPGVTRFDPVKLAASG